MQFKTYPLWAGEGRMFALRLGKYEGRVYLFKKLRHGCYPAPFELQLRFTTQPWYDTKVFPKRVRPTA